MFNVKRIREAIFGKMDERDATIAALTATQDDLASQVAEHKKANTELTQERDAAIAAREKQAAEHETQIKVKDNELAAVRGANSQMEQLLRAIAERQGIDVADLLGEDAGDAEPEPNPPKRGSK